jgi:hypothetical protein
MKPPPFPKCSTHGVHHTPGLHCKISDEDQKKVEEYEAEVAAETAARGPIKVIPLPNFHPVELLKGMALREKIRNQERKRLEQAVYDPEGD